VIRTETFRPNYRSDLNSDKSW